MDLSDLEVKFAKWVPKADGTPGVLEKAVPFRVIAIIIHHGDTPDSGHVVALVERKGVWWECNDDIVKRAGDKWQSKSTFRENSFMFLLRRLP